MNTTARFCENCGTAVEQGQSFCISCGAPVTSSPEATPAQSPPPVYPMQPPVAPTPQTPPPMVYATPPRVASVASSPLWMMPTGAFLGLMAVIVFGLTGFILILLGYLTVVVARAAGSAANNESYAIALLVGGAVTLATGILGILLASIDYIEVFNSSIGWPASIFVDNLDDPLGVVEGVLYGSSAIAILAGLAAIIGGATVKR